MARAVQRPNCAGEVAVVLRGARGVGKGQAVKPFGKVWGQHYLHVADPKHLVGSSFNAHLRDCSVLFADEAFWVGDVKREAVLKALITEETIMIEAKGVDAQPMRNVIHLLMASNEDWVIPAGAHERRFFVLDVGDAHRQDRAYFGAIEEDMGSGGLENLLDFFQHYDLAGFDVRHVPATAALFDQVQRKWNDAESLIFEMLETGRLPFWHKNNSGGRAWIAAWDLVPQDLKVREELKARKLVLSIGWALRGIVDSDGAQRQDRLRLHALPSLCEARARWQAKHGFEISGPPEDWVRPDEPNF
jgi:hypothetical protein